MRTRTLSTLMLALLVSLTTGCVLQIEKTFEMTDSVLETTLVSKLDPTIQVPGRPITLSGGTIFTIDVSTSIFDYLDATVDGDVTVDEVLFIAENVSIVLSIGEMCIGLSGPSGGTFEYEVLNENARFDVLVDTLAQVKNKNLPIFGGRTFPFPFDLQADMPLPLFDALGLFLGTSDLTISQDIDQEFDPGQGIGFIVELLGTVNLSGTDTFPTNQLMEECAVSLAELEL